MAVAVPGAVVEARLDRRHNRAVASGKAKVAVADSADASTVTATVVCALRTGSVAFITAETRFALARPSCGLGIELVSGNTNPVGAAITEF